VRLKNNRLTAALLLGLSHSGEFVNIIIISSLIHCIMFLSFDSWRLRAGKTWQI